jgi:hypothetical protein
MYLAACFLLVKNRQCKLRNSHVGVSKITVYCMRRIMLPSILPCALFCFVQVLELNLDNCRTTGQVEGLTESFVNLDYLSLNNAGLTSLKNFPKLPNLRRVSTILYT